MQESRETCNTCTQLNEAYSVNIDHHLFLYLTNWHSKICFLSLSLSLSVLWVKDEKQSVSIQWLTRWNSPTDWLAVTPTLILHSADTTTTGCRRLVARANTLTWLPSQFVTYAKRQRRLWWWWRLSALLLLCYPKSHWPLDHSLSSIQFNSKLMMIIIIITMIMLPQQSERQNGSLKLALRSFYTLFYILGEKSIPFPTRLAGVKALACSLARAYKLRASSSRRHLGSCSIWNLQSHCQQVDWELDKEETPSRLLSVASTRRPVCLNCLTRTASTCVSINAKIETTQSKWFQDNTRLSLPILLELQ